MRIAIVGAGVTGCAFYLWLEKLGITSKHTVVFYEARQPDDTTSTGLDVSYKASAIGANIGVAPNGLACLRNLDEALYDEVMQEGNPITRFRLSTATGWTLAVVPWASNGSGGLNIGRWTFWQCVKRRVSESQIQRKKVRDVTIGTTSSTLHFTDDTSADFDLVVGADGIWSAVRRAMFGNKYPPHYEGLIGVGGFVPASYMPEVQPEEIHEMNIVFGGNGFFGYAFHKDPTLPKGSAASANADRDCCWWSTHSLAECPEDWRHIDTNEAEQQLKKRHSSWKNEVVQKVVLNEHVDSVWPTMTTPLLPTWADRTCVLIGDAAHALQPASGQGVSQALEDAQALALLLNHHLAKEPEDEYLAGSIAAKQLCDLRMDRLKIIHDKALQTSAVKHDMNFLSEMFMYFIIWAINKLGVENKFRRDVFEYDIAKEVDKLLTSSP